MASALARSSILRPLAAALALSALGAGPGFAASANSLATHRAVYDLALDEATDRSGISGIYGRMVYEFNGSACDGFTVSFRFVTRIDTEEMSRVTDQQTTTYEDLNAGTFRFVTRSFVDERLDTETSGDARLTDAGVEVELEEPEERELTLSEGKFPTEHMLELIEKAKAGERFFESRIYDGSEEGDRVMLTTTVVGQLEQPADDDEEAARAGAFADDAYWPVTIAYFQETGTEDGTPEYQISFKLYENGFTRDLVMDYGDFVLTGTLAELETFEPQACAPQ